MKTVTVQSIVTNAASRSAAKRLTNERRRGLVKA
jgi:hypothetical protein